MKFETYGHLELIVLSANERKVFSAHMELSGCFEK